MWNGDFLWLPAGVQQTDDRVPVRLLLGEHLLVAGIEHPFRGDRILVDSKDCRSSSGISADQFGRA